MGWACYRRPVANACGEAWAGADPAAREKRSHADPVRKPIIYAAPHRPAVRAQLDSLSAVAGAISRGLMTAAESVCSFMSHMLVPNFFIIGGLGAVLIAYGVYYLLWFSAAQFMFLYVFLPGMAVVIASSIFHDVRHRRLHTAMLQAAWHAYDPATYYAPR